MFTLSAAPVKFVGLLVLFCFTTGWEGWQLLRARSGVARVSHGLHLVMSLLMLAMVPHGWWMALQELVPAPVGVALMAAGVLWFGWRALQAHPGHRGHAVACALMFLAMVWHLVGMMVRMRGMSMGSAGMDHSGMASSMPAMQHSTPMPSMAGMDHSGMSGMGGMSGMDHSEMSGMDHGGMTGMEHPLPTGHGPAFWVAVVGVPLMAWLLYAGMRALLRAVRPATGATPAGSGPRRLADASDAAMNLGMFWMSTGLLVPVLPFMAKLAF